jgi:hypothetical protein
MLQTEKIRVLRLDVFQEYMKRARSFLGMGKIIDEHDQYFWNSAFLYSISLELGCKSFLLYHQGGEYENLPFEDLKQKVDQIAKKKNHQLISMLKEISENFHVKAIKELLTKEYRRSGKYILTGFKFVEILESCYWEVRYPLPTSINDRYPITDEKNSFYDVTIDCHLAFFVEQILNELELDIINTDKKSIRGKISLVNNASSVNSSYGITN